LKPALAAARIAAACSDAGTEIAGRRWKNAEELLRDATSVAAAMTSTRVAITKVTPMKNRGDARYSGSTERCLTILALFSEKRPIWGIAEIADATSYPRGTVNRYASTLVSLGQLEQVAGRKYKRVAG
jgi:hypothetical protein